MENMFLNEYIERMGIVTQPELTAHAGPVQDTLKPLVTLLNRRDIFLCRLEKDEETILSRHLVFCLHAVYGQPELSAAAQDVYDWFGDNEYSILDDAQAALKLKDEEFTRAVYELQANMRIAPVYVTRMYHKPKQGGKHELLNYYECLWVTDFTWMDSLRRPERYRDLEYCISEARRLMNGRFSSEEMKSLIFKGHL